LVIAGFEACEGGLVAQQKFPHGPHLRSLKRKDFADSNIPLPAVFFTFIHGRKTP
jgi:hypothetical protein